MKKLVLTLIVSGLLTGVAFAAEGQKDACSTPCVCGSQQQGSVFQPLFPEYDLTPPLGG